MTRIPIKNPQSAIRNQKCDGSAIILAIVLTSLLAIIGVMFLLSSRVDFVATSAISENKDLSLAVDTVIADISEKLALDVPGGLEGQEYYDYPDINNLWLASLEPNSAGTWPHITDINDLFGIYAYNLNPEIIFDYQPASFESPADADGDGVSDSRWIVIPGMTSSKGKLVFTAVRVIDNGGMLNINTAKIFNPGSSIGASQADINLAALSQRGVGNGLPATAALKLDDWRRGTELSDLYEPNVIWQYGNPAGAFTPFDISDELKLRNRYILLNYNNPVKTRIGNLWDDVFDVGLQVPLTSSSEIDQPPKFWKRRVGLDLSDVETYDYRHIATTYNYDRIINPIGQKMVNINTASMPDIFNAIKAGLSDASYIDADDALAAQITANLIDYVDSPDYPANHPRYDPNNDVNVVYDNAASPVEHFGFEQPCIYISEIVTSFERQSADEVARSFAIELYNPYRDIMKPNDKWQILLADGNTIDITWPDNNAFKVIWNDPSVFFSKDINADPNVVPISEPKFKFTGGSTVSLQRSVNGDFITVDSHFFRAVREPNVDDFNSYTYKLQRDISAHKCIRRLWDFSIDEPPYLPTPPMSLGGYNNNFPFNNPGVIQAHPANGPFTNIGEFGQLFFMSAYDYGGTGPWDGITEPAMRINLADPNFQQVFKYLTVFDPTVDGIDNDGDGNGIAGPDLKELKIKGRININTAPWFVIAQLPWISYHTPGCDLARSIIDYRDNIAGPFRSTGQLMNVGVINNDPNNLRRMDYYYQEPLAAFPLMTPTDGQSDDFERQDIIFTRISNLVTVRSDVFTAYILVRIGQNGPQKRVIAILDRSGVTPTGGKVKIVAIHPVADPR